MTIQEILDELKIEYRESGHHHTRPGWIQLRKCPFCGSDNFHLGFNLHLKYFNCWRCGGHFGPTVLKAFGLPYERAREVFPHIDTGPKPYNAERTRISLEEPAGRLPISQCKAHRRYLANRGFDPEKIAEVWGIEGIKLAAKLSWRIYIPIIYRNQKVSWTTRAIGEHVAQRYVSASAQQEAINHRHLIYGGDYCNHSVVIVEGPTDAWAVGPGAGGLFGIDFSTAQVKKLAAIPRRFVCFDSEPEAQVRARALASQLSCFPGITENVLLDAKDPGKASQKELKLLRRVAAI